MTQISFPEIDFENTDGSLLISSKIKICVFCGHTLVDNYEFGISCENCGSLLVFNPNKKTPKNWREFE